MADPSIDSITRDRFILTLIGAFAGVSAWALVDILPDLVENERLIFLIVMITGGFFSALLASIGPLPLPRAVLAAALPAALLFYWAGFRFLDVEDFLETGHPIAAFATILIISLPFMIALQRPGEGWPHYPAWYFQVVQAD